MATRTSRSGGKGSNQYQTRGASTDSNRRAGTAAVASSAATPNNGDLPSPLPEVLLQHRAYTVSHYLGETYRVSGRDPFELHAPYQRGSVWTEEQRRNLIKSLLLRVPVGAVILSSLPYNADRDYDYRVVDGKQRLETVRGFVHDEFTIPGHWVNEDDLNDPADRAHDITFSQMSARGHHRIEMAQLPAMEFEAAHHYDRQDVTGKWVVTRRTETEMLQAEAELYLLINFGGVPQTEEDRQRAASISGRH